MTDFLIHLLASGNGAYLMAFGVISSIALLALVGTMVINRSTGRQIPLSWIVPITVLSVTLFVTTVVVELTRPGAYQRYHHDLYRAQYIGTPDNGCRVFELDDLNNPVLVPQVGADGQPVLGADGQPVMVRQKVRYKLLARPIGLEQGLTDLHIWLQYNPLYPQGSHLCSLPLTGPNGERNRRFGEQAQQAWDQVHGTEPEGEGEQGQQGRPGEGQPGQGQPGQGQPSPKPDIMVELPAQEGQEGQEGQAGTEGQPGSEGPNDGNVRNQDPQRQNSDGAITIEVPDRSMPAKP
jgi:hypothetical protein